MIRFDDGLPEDLIKYITDIRVDSHQDVIRWAQERRRRTQLAPTGYLNILAADHPARRLVGVGENAMRMADRQTYLARIVQVLISGAMDGIMASMDIIQDLFIIDRWIEDNMPGQDILDGVCLIASLNRSGLHGAAWEIEDPISGPSPKIVKRWNLDGAKLLLRLCDDDWGSLRTLMSCVETMRLCHQFGVTVFLEPLPVVKSEAGYTVCADQDALAKIVGVASALGDSSLNMWLKLPYCEGFDKVAAATTLPILLLGGGSTDDPDHFLRELKSALDAGPNVRGALVGRNVLFPRDREPVAVATAVQAIISRFAHFA